MLITCKECGGLMSDKAYACPNCGCPTDTKTAAKQRLTRRPRLPNGFGQITELKGRNLRKPFRVMVTVGKTKEGRPICKILKPEGYFKTYREAYDALMKYNVNPYNLDLEMTMDELYKKWSERHFKTIKPQSAACIESAWKNCQNIYGVEVREVRIRHFKNCLDSIESNSAKKAAKNVFNMMMDYAVEYEITDKNYARSFGIGKEIHQQLEADRKGHISFTDDEMRTLWKLSGDYYADMLLIQCYTGFRPQELLSIKTDDVNLEKKNITAGMKTKAGTNRIVPIHSGIFELVKKNYESAKQAGSEYLFFCYSDRNEVKGEISYYVYCKNLKNIIRKYHLNTNHRLHDPRKQFATMAKKYRLDEYAIKMIIGHHISDITESIYTDRDPSWLNEEIEKIKVDDVRASV